MNVLKDGDSIQAVVLGFLPGRRVVLDVLGESVLAWSDLPLVRGEVITAVVEATGDGARQRCRLRVMDNPDRQGDEPVVGCLRRSGIPADDLDLFVGHVVTGLGLTLDASLLGEVREYVRKHERGLDTGVVPLRKLKGTIFNFLAARARGLPASPRVLAAVGSRPGTRLGTALLRLMESLHLLAGALGGGHRRDLTDRALHLRTFCIDLATAPLHLDIRAAVSRLGYVYESKLAGRGHCHWEADEQLDREDLKGALLSLWACLDSLGDKQVSRGRRSVRRDLERSMAWCGQALDTIEAIQVQNIPASGDPETAMTFQLPVLWGSEAGDLLLLLSDGMSRFWLDLPGGECIAAELATAGGDRVLGLHVPEWAEHGNDPGDGDWIASLAARIRGRGGDVEVRRIQGPPEIEMDVRGMDVPSCHVDMML
ncbi:MAG: hypothetical protein KAW17_01175 [Candidatus Eisenbacteria sp.]|nr:hypothetical protein [Candidatus Eisenbacteria bacterium]